MPEYKYINQEIWICEPVQCVAPPTVGVVLSEDDGSLCLARLIDDGTGSNVKLVLPHDDASDLIACSDSQS